MKTKWMALFLVASSASLAFGSDKISYGFLNSIPSEVASLASSSSLIYSYDMKSSLEWDNKTVNESNLFDGFKSFESWNVMNDTNETMIYASEVAFVVDKTVDQASLSRLSSADFISGIDPGFQHTAVSSEEANSAFVTTQEEGRASALRVLEAMVKRGQVSALDAEKATGRINKTAQVNSNAKWCSSHQSQCMKSTAIIPALYRGLLSTASTLGVNVPDSIDIYSEIKPLSLSNGASAGVSLTGFLANKTLISMKNEIFAWDLRNGSSLITIKTYVTLEKDDLDKFKSLGSYDFVLGNTYFNRDEGIAMGLPLYNQRMAEALKKNL